MVVDEFTRECLAVDVAGSIRSARIVDVFMQLASVHGAPATRGPRTSREFVALALPRWAQAVGIDAAFCRSGRALAEWHGRIVQREVSQRATWPWSGFGTRGSQGRHRTVAASLQRRTAAHEPRRPHVRRVQEQDPEPEGLVRREPDGRRSPEVAGPKKPGTPLAR
jgi:hypothetical protein